MIPAEIMNQSRTEEPCFDSLQGWDDLSPISKYSFLKRTKLIKRSTGAIADMDLEPDLLSQVEEAFIFAGLL